MNHQPTIVPLKEGPFVDQVYEMSEQFADMKARFLLACQNATSVEYVKQLGNDPEWAAYCIIAEADDRWKDEFNKLAELTVAPFDTADTDSAEYDVEAWKRHSMLLLSQISCVQSDIDTTTERILHLEETAVELSSYDRMFGNTSYAPTGRQQIIMLNAEVTYLKEKLAYLELHKADLIQERDEVIADNLQLQTQNQGV